MTEHRYILGMRVDATSYEDAAARVLRWSEERSGRYVCVATVHMVMESHDSPEFKRIVNGADLVTSDGMPLVWMLNRLGVENQTRVYGPTLTLEICKEAEQAAVPVGFYGASPATLGALTQNLQASFPNLNISYAYSPPFRPLTPAEDEQIVADIKASGARILFVGLGCPRQERWMVEHAERLPVVMLGVGAAFDFHAGSVKQAPAWMQGRGLEWLFRLAVEPRRLWRRYFKHNPRFLALAALQLWRHRRSRA